MTLSSMYYTLIQLLLWHCLVVSLLLDRRVSFVILSIYLSVCLSVHLSVYLSICVRAVFIFVYFVSSICLYRHLVPVICVMFCRSAKLSKRVETLQKKEAEETAALENMVQMVEKNLQLTTVW